MVGKEVQDLGKMFFGYRALSGVSKKIFWSPVSVTRVNARGLSSETNAAPALGVSKDAVKPFDSIPSPSRLPVFGNLHHFGPFGSYSFEKLYDAYYDFHRKYGPIVSLDLGRKLVLLFDPSDIEKLLRVESNPQRPVFEALKKYRLSRKDIYSSGGLFTENGAEWHRLRKSVNWMMKPQIVHSYLPAHDQIADSFVRRIRQSRNDRSEIPDFLSEIYKYTVEAAGLVCFGTRLGVIEDSDTDSNIKGLAVIKATNDFLQAMADTFLGIPWWIIFNTPTYKKLAKSQDIITEFAMECASAAKAKIEADPHENDASLEFLRRLINNSDLTLADITILITDIFGAGIDTTGNTIGFLLYNLSKRPDAQEKLFQEMQEHNVISEPVTAEKLNSLTYLKACIKENHSTYLNPDKWLGRSKNFPSDMDEYCWLNSSAGGTARILSAPTVFSGYQVPENITCIGLNPVICIQEKHFEDPLSYKPERWINNESGELRRTGHPFCVLPFSHGSRRCIGQRFAEQEIRLCIIKRNVGQSLLQYLQNWTWVIKVFVQQIIQNFRVEYDGPEIGKKVRLMLTPDKPLNFRFVDRK